MATEAEYYTAQKLINFLGVLENGSILNLDGSSIPSLTTVEEMISHAEADVEKRTRRNWRSTPITKSNQPYTLHYRRGQRRSRVFQYPYIDLKYKYIQSITYLGLWDGNEYYDLVANGTEGVAVGNQDYYVDYEQGRIFIHSRKPLSVQNNIKVSFTYGEGNPAPSGIVEIVKKFAGADFIETYGSMFQYTIEDVSGMNKGIIADKWRENANDRILDYKEIAPLNLP